MEETTTPTAPARPVTLHFQLQGKQVRPCVLILEAEQLRFEAEGEASMTLDRTTAFDRLAFLRDQLVITGGAAHTLKGTLDDVAAVKRWIGPPTWKMLEVRQKKLAQPQLATGVLLVVIALMGNPPRWWTFNFGITMVLVGLLSRIVITRWVFAAISMAWGMMALLFGASVYLGALGGLGVVGALFACFMVWLHYREFARFAGLPPRPRAR